EPHPSFSCLGPKECGSWWGPYRARRHHYRPVVDRPQPADNLPRLQDESCIVDAPQAGRHGRVLLLELALELRRVVVFVHGDPRDERVAANAALGLPFPEARGHDAARRLQLHDLIRAFECDFHRIASRSFVGTAALPTRPALDEHAVASATAAVTPQSQPAKSRHYGRNKERRRSPAISPVWGIRERVPSHR